MASEITYAELSFKTESKSSGTNSDSPAAPKEKTSPRRSNPCFPKKLLVPLLLLVLLAILFFAAFIIFSQKYFQLLDEKTTVKQGTKKHTELECINNSPGEDKLWKCCPKNWKSFGSHCYFYPPEARSWNESEERCSSLEAHLVVVTSKEEQHFIIQNMNSNTAYYVGLSDPDGQRNWQWVDQTPYNESATFWHPNEPNDRNERCVLLNFRAVFGQWGWNDVRCDSAQGSVCEMMNIYL